MIDARMAGLAILLLAAPLAGCKVVQIADQEAAAPARFNADAYASSLWQDQALPHFTSTAHSIAEVLPVLTTDLSAAGAAFGYRSGEGSPWSFIVSGSGTVVAKNTQSRAGTLEVAIDGLAAPVVVQIGPVIRGNAVRDALPFVSFKDFVNQMEYANAGKALTALAVEGIAGAAAALDSGDTVRFIGAISISRSTDAVLVTPVVLEAGQ